MKFKLEIIPPWDIYSGAPLTGVTREIYEKVRKKMDKLIKKYKPRLMWLEAKACRDPQKPL